MNKKMVKRPVHTLEYETTSRSIIMMLINKYVSDYEFTFEDTNKLILKI